MEVYIKIALIITAVHVVFTWDGMLLQRIGILGETYLPEWVHKPLYSCVVCMSSIWGIPLLWLFQGGYRHFSVLETSLMWGFDILILCGINIVVSLVLEVIDICRG